MFFYQQTHVLQCLSFKAIWDLKSQCLGIEHIFMEILWEPLSDPILQSHINSAGSLVTVDSRAVFTVNTHTAVPVWDTHMQKPGCLRNGQPPCWLHNNQTDNRTVQEMQEDRHHSMCAIPSKKHRSALPAGNTILATLQISRDNIPYLESEAIRFWFGPISSYSTFHLPPTT